jgi:hypothetical protein
MFPGTTVKKTFAQHVADMREELSLQMEFHRMKAALQKNYYDALLKEGFTKAEALELTAKM